MGFAKDSLSTNAKGGTEIMKFLIQDNLPKELLDKFQIFVSRVHEPLSDKHVRILWLQDLADDPQAEHLANGGWRNFHMIVFASHWQMRGFMNKYQIPWSRCVVIQNGVEPIPDHEKPKDKIRLVYTSTPHRGLNILYYVFDKLVQEPGYENLELDVFSSYKLYGWEERDKNFKELFTALENHPKINYHGTASNQELRETLKQCHIFAYPSIWEETSCLCLMEAMSAKLICIHPNYGALPETSGNWTFMYHWNEDINKHAQIFYTNLKFAINMLKDRPEEVQARLSSQKTYIDVFNSAKLCISKWKQLLESMQNLPTEIEKEMFIYQP